MKVETECYTKSGAYKGLYVYKQVGYERLEVWPKGKKKSNCYIMGWLGDKWGCNCPGYFYQRGQCCHVEYCPFEGPRREVITFGEGGPLADGARNANVILPSGEVVNCYKHFWQNNAI
jgi:hypothetical protein